MSLVLSYLLNPSALAGDFEQVIVPVIYFLIIPFPLCLLLPVSILCIYGVLADFEQVIISALLYLPLFVN